MNKKNQISSILNNCNNLVDIFNFHKKKTPEKKIFFEKKSENWNLEELFCRFHITKDYYLKQ